MGLSSLVLFLRHDGLRAPPVPPIAPPAGNYGADTTGTSTVTTPSISKNCISVGASKSYQASYQSSLLAAPVYLATLTVSVGAQPVSPSVGTS